MPTYDMRCSECDSVFEVRRSPGDLEGVCCPSCGGASKRIFTPVGVIFKGSGFHNTDYRSGAKPPANEAPDAKPADEPASTPACPSKDATSPKCSGCPASATE
jgi:putative FmdB family regulatory protein